MQTPVHSNAERKNSLGLGKKEANMENVLSGSTLRRKMLGQVAFQRCKSRLIGTSMTKCLP
jgi:hypothetical protein